MYRTCIFCTKALGSNESLERFPVGSRVAYDAFKGRLWAICPRCTRWNLAPIEERWEAVEEAEEHFRDARQRVHSENIGLARLPDGTRLVRIGSALPGELAAWRYGSTLVKRRRNTYLGIGAAVAAGGAVVAGMPVLAGVGIPYTALQLAIQGTSIAAQVRMAQRVVLSLPAADSPTGAPLVLRMKHIRNSQLGRADDQVTISVAEPRPDTRPWYQKARPGTWHLEYGDRLTLTGRHAEAVTARAMVQRNSQGASQKDVEKALGLLQEAGSAQAFIARLSGTSPTIVHPTTYRHRGKLASPSAILGTFRGERMEVGRMGKQDVLNPLWKHDALALEMALHDESERRALEGELWMLEEAWREAEEIAQIADALPDDLPAP